jgi:hypothetical protein
MKKTLMKKRSELVDDDDPLDHEIDFSNARPNPFWLGLVDRRCVRLLAPDVAAAFPNDAAVNDALHELLHLRAAQAVKKVSANTASAPKPKKKKA